VHLLGPGSSGFVQIQRPHLPDGHALRQRALGEALARPLLAHLVASAARALSQHVRHMLCYWLCFNERIYLILLFLILSFLILLFLILSPQITYINEKIECM
jgi:hypothetical protein